MADLNGDAISADVIKEMVARANDWVVGRDGVPIERDRALGEQHLALDVLGLVNHIVGLERTLEDAIGPHCDSCGNPIDPDTCHCGSAVDNHGGGDGHSPVPMGCVCGYHDEDYKRLAKARGELLYQKRCEIAAARTEIDGYKQATLILAEELAAAKKLLAEVQHQRDVHLAAPKGEF